MSLPLLTPLILYVWAATLGYLPPPCCLSSVTLLSEAQTGPVFSSPTQLAAVSWAGASTSETLPSPLVTGPQFGMTVSGSPSPPGLVLSPAAEPIPKKIVDKIRSGQFVEMKELLTDNLSLISQLEAVQGIAPLHMLGAARPRLQEISSLPTWCYCFLGYMAARTSDPVTRDQLAYARLLIKEAQRHGGLGWLDYDRVFRQQVAADPSLCWNTLIPGLQATTILGQQSVKQPVFCTLCREVDHTRDQCALACLQSPDPAAAAVTRSSRPPALRRRADYTCISWNKGSCLFPGQCSYRHICAICQASHRAKDCPRAPDSSVYKQRPGAARQHPLAHVPTSRQS